METVYYHLDARRISTCDMASGETSPQCRSYAVLHKVEEKRASQGAKVLDLEAYRRKFSADTHEEEETWDDDERYEAVIPALPLAPAARTDTRRTHRAGFALDFFATLAILVMATVVVIGFLPLL